MGKGTDANLFMTFLIFTVFAENVLLITACGVGKGSYTNREFPPFRENQKKPHVDEESNIASGPFSHKVRFGTKEFKTKIVRYFGTNIVFRDDEGNGSDRYMTKRCERALKQLATHVRVKWRNKVKVRVIEAWDEDGEHPPRSLHYEGRAIDITTSDRDRKKYGALASLAYFKAEFDWVAYLDGHVHVSCKRDDAVEETNSCFPGHSTVITSDGKTKQIQELKIGEKVLSSSPDGGLVFSRVLMLMDAKPSIVIKNYIEIETKGPRRRLQLTQKHLLIVSKGGKNFETIFAEKVVPGDMVKVLAENGTQLVEAVVSSVKMQRQKGAFAPLTEEGTILVNGVLASCYALTEDSWTAHLSFAPWRYLFRLTDFPLKYQVQQGQHWYTRMLAAINNLFGILPEVYAK